MSTKKSKPSTAGFSDFEKAAMKERAAELRRSKKKEDAEKDALAKIAEMPEPERSRAMRLHELVKSHAPQLSAKTMYGMPAYADEDGKVVCFYQAASKFDTRYGTLNFNDNAKLDDGTMWPVSFALTQLGEAEEKKIVALVKKAVS